MIRITGINRKVDVDKGGEISDVIANRISESYSERCPDA